MFHTLAPRLAAWFAIAIGCIAGGALALLDASRLPTVLRAPVVQAPRTRAVGKPPSLAQSSTPAPAAPASAAGALVGTDQVSPASPVRSTEPPPFSESPISSADELHHAERDCARDIPDACRRAAAAHTAGGVVMVATRRAARYRNLALKGYIRHCERNLPGACYALARLYYHGDGVRVDRSYAKQLLSRVVEVCRYRKAAICTELGADAAIKAPR